MKVEQRRELIKNVKQAKEVFNRIKRKNKKTKLTLMCITNLIKKFPNIDVECEIDSSQDYDFNYELLNNLGGLSENINNY